MKIPFWKMHGAGNDFILVDARKLSTTPSREQIAAWCQRRTGVGADGLILLRPPRTDGHFRMQFFNPDGGEAGMCGNGARCAARLAHELQIAPASMTIETAAGAVQAQMLSDGRVRLELPPPSACQLDGRLVLGNGDAVHYAFADTGVPHAVIECEDTDLVAVGTLGRAIRQHPCFAPHGTNVDFITITGPDSLRIRTYERGVEDETLACGTGIAAAAVTAVLRGRVVSPVSVLTAGGDRLQVAFTPTDHTPGPITLTGPAVHVFTGELAEHPGNAEPQLGECGALLGTPSPSSASEAPAPAPPPAPTATRRAGARRSQDFERSQAFLPHWHSRGYLPHLDDITKTQSITFRLSDSLPQTKLAQLRQELAHLPAEEQSLERRKRIDHWLDAGMGSCVLRHPAVARIMQETLLRFDGERYRLLAWCIMPNHVHALIEPQVELGKIVQSWKSYTARWVMQRRAELGLGAPREKPIWMREYWDRFIRDQKHLQAVTDYIHQNPVKAHLCPTPATWPWSSATPGNAEPQLGACSISPPAPMPSGSGR